MTLQHRRTPPRNPPKYSFLATSATQSSNVLNSKSPTPQRLKDGLRLPPINRRRKNGHTSPNSNTRRSIPFPIISGPDHGSDKECISAETNNGKAFERFHLRQDIILPMDDSSINDDDDEKSKPNANYCFGLLPKVPLIFRRTQKRKQRRMFVVCMAMILAIFILVDVPWLQQHQSQTNFPLALRKYKFPSIGQILQGGGLKHMRDDADVSWLLQFAIVGFPKSGTSSMMKYLNFAFGDDNIRISQKEECSLRNDSKVHYTVKQLYRDSYPGGDFLQGLKCPRHLEDPTALRNYQRYFPKTSFIVGVRHPVLWFESFYNFRINNEWEMDSSLTSFIGSCFNPFLCTDRGAFHMYLAQLGKTNLSTSDEERSLFPSSIFTATSQQNPPSSTSPFSLQTFGPHNRQIFLYDVQQLQDSNDTRNNEFRQDLGKFLGILDSDNLTFSSSAGTNQSKSPIRLRPSLPPLVHVSPGMQHNNTKYQSWLDLQKIDICDDNPSYRKVRQVLLEHGRNASLWIRNYFLQSSDVHVSSQYYLETILQSWSIDPCLHRHATKFSIQNNKRTQRQTSNFKKIKREGRKKDNTT